MNIQTACSEEEGIQGWWKNNKSYQDTRALSNELFFFKKTSNDKHKKNENRKHLGNMSLIRHNKENICSSKNEISNTGRRANEQFDIQWFFYFL